MPLDYVGFTVPDELFAGYGLGLDERWRALPDLHFVAIEELPSHLTGDSYRRETTRSGLESNRPPRRTAGVASKGSSATSERRRFLLSSCTRCKRGERRPGYGAF